ncbi:unnamed protein product, partial [Porites evermanni]
MKFHLSCLRSSDQVPKIWYCPTCQFKRNAKTRNAVQKDVCSKALSLNSICICNSKPRPGDRLLECHSEDCLNGKFFHLHCLKYKRMPNNSKTTWVCNSCKGKPHKANDVNIATAQSGENDSSRNLIQAEYDIIESPTGWLDCSVLQEAHILLKQVNP